MHSNFKKANAAPRCQYIRLNDQPCTQPALKDQIFCRFHDLVDHPLPDTRLIPFVEDATTLQLALMQVIRGLQRGEITRPVAGTILYALQIAAQNLKHFSEEVGHPFAQTNVTRKPAKAEKDAEELEGPSLAEILLERLQLVDPEEATSAKATLQSAQSPDDPINRSPGSPPCPSVVKDVQAPDRQINRSPDGGAIDRLEACIERRPAKRSRLAGERRKSKGAHENRRMWDSGHPPHICDLAIGG